MVLTFSKDSTAPVTGTVAPSHDEPTVQRALNLDVAHLVFACGYETGTLDRRDLLSSRFCSPDWADAHLPIALGTKFYDLDLEKPLHQPDDTAAQMHLCKVTAKITKTPSPKRRILSTIGELSLSWVPEDRTREWSVDTRSGFEETQSMLFRVVLPSFTQVKSLMLADIVWTIDVF